MLFKRLLFLLSFSSLVIITCRSTLAVNIQPAIPTAAIATNTFDYAADIDRFLGAGADAYLAWQYSGDKGGTIESDSFSFFRNSDTCTALNDASKKDGYGGKIGVNIWRYHHHINEIDLNYLKEHCGTSIIRFFGTDSPDLVVSAVQKLQGSGIKAVIAFYNYSMGGMPTFFTAGNYATAKQEAIAITTRLVQANLTGSIYTLELANEPHCGNEESCVPSYIAWAKDVSAALRATGYNGDISLGQASQVAHSPSSRGDSVTMGSPLDFQASNDITTITKTSGHHYGTQYISENLKALKISKDTLHKPFYIGEAAGPSTTTVNYNAIPTTNSYTGGIDGCENITAADVAPNPWWLGWFISALQKNNKKKCYPVKAPWNNGTTVSDPCGAAGTPTALFKDPANRVLFINPSKDLTAFVNSIIRNPAPDQIYEFGGGGTSNSYAATTHNNPAPNYPLYPDMNGSGQGATSRYNPKSKAELIRIFNDFHTGALSRMTKYDSNNDQTVKDWLCVLARSNADIDPTAKACIRNEAYNVLDYQLGFLGDLTDEAYTISLPNASYIDTDRTKTTSGQTDQMIKSSDLYCALKFNCDVSDLGVAGGKSAPINAHCENAIKMTPPAHLTDCQQGIVETLTPDQQVFCVAWDKLRIALVDNKTNVPASGFTEVCTDNPGTAVMSVCAGEVAKYQNVPFCEKYHFLDLLDHPGSCGNSSPDEILSKYGGRYVLLADGMCQSCQVTKELFPGLHQAQVANKATGCGLATAQDTHAANLVTQNRFDMSKDEQPLDRSFTVNSLGINNYSNVIDVKTFGWKVENILSSIFGHIKVKTCDLRSHVENLPINGTIQPIEIFDNSCDSSVPIRVDTYLWTNKETQIAFNCSRALNQALLSSQDQTQIGTTEMHGYEANYETEHCATALGPREMSMPGAAKVSGGCGDNVQNAQVFKEYTGKSDINGSMVRSCNFYTSDEIKQLGLKCPSNSTL